MLKKRERQKNRNVSEMVLFRASAQVDQTSHRTFLTGIVCAQHFHNTLEPQRVLN